MFVGNLPMDSSEDTVRDLFSKFGKVHSIQIAADVFTGKCRGFGFVSMEGHEARAAIAGLNGKTYDGKSLKVQFEEARNNKRKRR